VVRRHLRYPQHLVGVRRSMMNLAEYRRRSPEPRRLPALGGAGRKGRHPQQGRLVPAHARFRGPDLDSATPAELVAITSRLNNALRRLGSGWAIFIEAQRQPAIAIRSASFPIPPRVWSMPSAGRSSRKKARISRAGIS
jgi:hypothetical protein